MSEYPEHDKLRAVADQSQAIGEFLDTSGYTLCKAEQYRYMAVQKSINQILAEYFGIDLNEIENEKREILRKQRERIAIADLARESRDRS